MSTEQFELVFTVEVINPRTKWWEVIYTTDSMTEAVNKFRDTLLADRSVAARITSPTDVR